VSQTKTRTFHFGQSKKTLAIRAADAKREKTCRCEQVRLVWFNFLFDEKWREFINPITERRIQDQRNSELRSTLK